MEECDAGPAPTARVGSGAAGVHPASRITLCRVCTAPPQSIYEPACGLLFHCTVMRDTLVKRDSPCQGTIRQAYACDPRGLSARSDAHEAMHLGNVSNPEVTPDRQQVLLFTGQTRSRALVWTDRRRGRHDEYKWGAIAGPGAAANSHHFLPSKFERWPGRPKKLPYRLKVPRCILYRR